MVVGWDLWKAVVQPQSMTSLVVPKCSPLLCLHALIPGTSVDLWQSLMSH